MRWHDTVFLRISSNCRTQHCWFALKGLCFCRFKPRSHTLSFSRWFLRRKKPKRFSLMSRKKNIYWRIVKPGKQANSLPTDLQRCSLRASVQFQSQTPPPCFRSFKVLAHFLESATTEVLGYTCKKKGATFFQMKFCQMSRPPFQLEKEAVSL